MKFITLLTFIFHKCRNYHYYEIYYTTYFYKLFHKCRNY